MAFHSSIFPIPDNPPEPPRRKRWTRAECRELGDAGFLPERYELIDGEILEKMPKNRLHVLALMLLAAWLEDVFGRNFVQKQDPVFIPVPDEFTTEPEPDIAVTKREASSYLTDSPGPDDILLIAEISDSTLQFDLQYKANLYAAAGIVEYWVVDIKGRRLYAHHLPSPDGYREVRIYTEQEPIATLAKPDAAVTVKNILPPQGIVGALLAAPNPTP